MRWSSRLPTRFLVSRRTSQHPSPYIFKYRTLTFYGQLSHAVLLMYSFVTIMVLGSSAFARRYQQNRYYFLFLQVLRYFSSLRFPSALQMSYLPYDGFPHSDSHGSSRTYCSPWRFAVSCVLHRLLVPRHPLCALFSLTFFYSFIYDRIYLLFKDQILNILLRKTQSFKTEYDECIWKFLYTIMYMPFSLERR